MQVIVDYDLDEDRPALHVRWTETNGDKTASWLIPGGYMSGSDLRDLQRIVQTVVQLAKTVKEIDG